MSDRAVHDGAFVRLPSSAKRALKTAPAVTYPVGRSRRLALLLAAPWVLAALCLLSVLVWPFANAPTAVGALLAVLVLLLNGWALRRFWRAQVVRQLIWDGQAWHLDAPVAQGSGEISVRLDVQHCLLLLYRAPGARRGTWLWADAAAYPQRWHLLRCALYSSGIGPNAQERLRTDGLIERA
ncbi:MAG: hypothetical protein Q4G71_15320 [Pseudomonadota bacterium]|nr:hypothetical protein [Pseudomonadota bacterium]